MAKISGHAERVLQFREVFLTLDENRFFEIMRMYLGEIKTPYSKPNLIENLEKFLRKEKSIQAIRAFLTPEEIQIISAVVFIPDSTEEKLAAFFGNQFTFTRLYETIVNLEERLIFFKVTEKGTGRQIIKFNPFLEAGLGDLINLECLLPQVKISKKENGLSFALYNELICAAAAFIAENPSLTKMDGSLKKHAAALAEEVFGTDLKRFETVLRGFVNLGIAKENLKGLEIDWKRLEVFTQQNILAQYLYLIIASAGHYSRDGLRKQAQLLFDTLKNTAQSGCTRDIFLRTGYLVAARPLEVEAAVSKGGGRFAQILNSYHANGTLQEKEEIAGVQTAGNLERVFDSIVELGLLVKTGVTADDQAVYVPGEIFAEFAGLSEAGTAVKTGPDLNGMLNIDSGFDIQLMPGYKDSDILPLLKFVQVKKFDTVSLFAIDRQSIMAGFDKGLDGKKIKSLLANRTRFNLPEVLSVQIEDWEASYSCASLFKGYVLKLEGKAAVVAQNNKVISPHIHCVIAPGVFLLDVEDDQQALNLIKESGLDFIGNIKTARKTIDVLEYLPVNFRGHKIDGKTDFATGKDALEKLDAADVNKKSGDAIYRELMASLKKMDLEPEMRESLELRISRRVILSEDQLTGASVRVERVSAGSMDYAGKIYIAELAIKNGEMLEIEAGSSGEVICGKPVFVIKHHDDSFVQVIVPGCEGYEEYSLGKAKSVRRIRKSIYAVNSR